MKKVLDRGKPVLGICRGHQVLTVASGGTLYQDLSEHEGAKKVYDCNFKIEPPICVQEAIKAYREDNDWLNDFLYECCEINDSYKEKSGDLYTEYRNHCSCTGEYTRSTSDFYTAIEHAGFERKRDKSGRYVLGLRIKPLLAA